MSKTILLPLSVIGCGLGMVVGGKVMNYDINAFLEFYSARFLNRCIINLSIDLIENYLKDNFEKNEEISTSVIVT